jgi:hypothetical protein
VHGGSKYKIFRNCELRDCFGDVGMDGRMAVAFKEVDCESVKSM